MKCFRICSLFVLGGLVLAAYSFAQSVKVSSFPDGAHVSIDGTDTGQITPMNKSVTVGLHTITVSYDQWQTYSTTVDVVNGVNYVTATLTPVVIQGPQGIPGEKGDKGDPGAPGTPGLSTLYFTSNPEVSLFFSRETEILALSLPAGNYLLHAKVTIQTDGTSVDGDARCWLRSPIGDQLDISRNDLGLGLDVSWRTNVAPYPQDMNFPLQGVVTLSDAGRVTVTCLDSSSSGGTIQSASFSALPITNLNLQ